MAPHHQLLSVDPKKQPPSLRSRLSNPLTTRPTHCAVHGPEPQPYQATPAHHHSHVHGPQTQIQLHETSTPNSNTVGLHCPKSFCSRLNQEICNPLRSPAEAKGSRSNILVLAKNKGKAKGKKRKRKKIVAPEGSAHQFKKKRKEKEEKLK